MNLQHQFTAEDSWRVQLEDCKFAQTTIDLENYIFTETKVGEEFLSVLEDKAKEGVLVRILLDMWGSLKLFHDEAKLARLRAAGVNILFFNPFSSWRIRNMPHWLSLRDHRKFLLVDKKIAHIGSVCIDQPMRGWLENGVRLESPHVAMLSESFDSLWQATQRGVLLHKAFHIDLGNDLNYLSSTPYVGKRKIHAALLGAVRRSRSSITFVNPYFIPTMQLQFALFRALKRGVKVRIILPEQTNPRFIDYANQEYTRSLALRGAQVSLVKGPLHSKYYVVDDTWAMAGSANIDTLSLLHDYEHVFVGNNPGLVMPLVDNFQSLLQQSKPMPTESGFKKRVLGLLVRPIVRFL